MLLASLPPTATVLSPDRARVLSFDREGRLLTLFDAGRTYKRDLASGLHLRSSRQGVRHRRLLSAEESRARYQEVYASAGELRAGAAGELRRRLEEEILVWDADRLLAERRRFEAVYRPVSILPPDLYRAIVLQATEGCTWNECTFCSFYMNRVFQIKTADEFADHAVGVKQLLGRDLARRCGIFLADGNALALSTRRLAPLVEIARETFPGHALYGFVDLYSGERRAPGEWAELAAAGLDRVYVGMETGLDELLAFVNKPGSAAELVDFVGVLKEAGLRVSLIVMVGLGGETYRVRHGEATLACLEAISLDRGDLVYLSPFVEHPGSEYQRRRQAAGIEPLSAAAIEQETESLAAAVRVMGVRAGRYDIREFVY